MPYLCLFMQVGDAAPGLFVAAYAEMLARGMSAMVFYIPQELVSLAPCVLCTCQLELCCVCSHVVMYAHMCVSCDLTT